MNSDSIRLLRYIKPHWKILTLGLLFSLLLPLADIFFPWLLKQIIDSVIIDRAISKLMPFIVILIFLYLGRAIAYFLSHYLIAILGARTGNDLKKAFFNKLLKLAINFYDEQPTGKVMSAITDDLRAIEMFLSYLPLSIVQNFIIICGCLGFMLFLDWRLFLIAAILAPVINAFLRLFSKRFRVIAGRSQDKKMEMSNILQEIFSSIRLIKAYTSENREINRFKYASKEYMNSFLKWGRYKNIIDCLTPLFNDLATIFVLWYGISLILTGRLSIGTLVAFLVYMKTIRGVFTQLVSDYSNLEYCIVCSKRVFKILDLEAEESKGKKGLPVLPKIKGLIKFQEVSFNYAQDKPFIFNNLSFEITPGEVTAILGSNGAGKTTLVNLILGFYSPQKGKILIDGKDINQVQLRSLRKQISVVPQHDVLFNTTIWENISYGSDNLNADSIKWAAKISTADQFIDKLSRGYDTIVGERGLKLSGGERQKINIARAILRNPQIFIFDEATSYIDETSENSIVAALMDIIHGKTMIIISHKHSFLKLSQKAFFLNHGNVKEINISQFTDAAEQAC